METAYAYLKERTLRRKKDKQNMSKQQIKKSSIEKQPSPHSGDEHIEGQ